MASFAYTLGATGNQTALSETVNGSSRTYAWAYDYSYRLTNENIISLDAASYDRAVAEAGYCANPLNQRPKLGYNLDEYPFASSWQGDKGVRLLRSQSGRMMFKVGL